MIRFLLLLVPFQALALSPAAREFMDISRTLEPVQCEKRQLRRQMALAEAERRDADIQSLRQKFARLNRDPKTAKLESAWPSSSRCSSARATPRTCRRSASSGARAFYRCD